MSDHRDDPVLFYGRKRRQYQAFSNFYHAPFVLDECLYPTVEHRFQACKAAEECQHEWIRSAETPGEAKKRGRQVHPLRGDWERIKQDVMLEALLAKFRTHAKLKELLLSTDDRPIHEDSPSDAEWGWLGGQGRDLLGHLLVEVRQILRKE